METQTSARSKGGRPKKVIRLDQLLGVKCSVTDRAIISGKAKAAGLTVSEYLRELGIHGKIRGGNKVLPRQVLELTGTLNHLAANINQIAHKRNRGEVLNGLERAILQDDAAKLRVLTAEIKNHFK